jgi:molybdopterin synthase catalytic subunit
MQAKDTRQRWFPPRQAHRTSGLESHMPFLGGLQTRRSWNQAGIQQCHRRTCRNRQGASVNSCHFSEKSTRTQAVMADVAEAAAVAAAAALVRSCHTAGSQGPAAESVAHLQVSVEAAAVAVAAADSSASTLDLCSRQMSLRLRKGCTRCQHRRWYTRRRNRAQNSSGTAHLLR